MRNPLNKRLPREFTKHASKYIGIFVILVCTILIGSAFLATMDGATYTLRQNDEECRIEDGQFESTAPIPENLHTYFEEQNVEITENFYTTVNDYEGSAKILVFDERKTLNLPSVFEGTLPATDKEIAIDRLFAQNRDINIGDTLKLNHQDFVVTATISLPDYSSLFKSNQDLVMNTSDFGVSVVTKEGFSRFGEDTLTYRYSYKFDSTSLSDSEERELIEDIQKQLLLEGVTLQSFLSAENNPCISFLREDMGKDGPMIKVFIYILIVIIAFVFAVLTSNTIESEAAIIGTLRASGYFKREILLHYLSPTIIVAVVSSVIGNALGYTVMLKPFEDIYYTSYCLPPIIRQFSLEAFITTTIIPVVLMVAVNTLMLCSKLSLSPLKFLRKDLHKRKQKRAVRLPDFSFIHRFRLRVILQNKISYLILFFGIFLASFLLMFGIGLEPLMNHYVDEIDDTLPYEYQYILKAPVEVDGGEKLEVYTLKTWYQLGETNIDVSFMGISENSDFFKELELPETEHEIIVTTPLAKKLNLTEGDTLVFEDEYYEKEYSLTVAGIYDYNSSLGVFMKQESLNKMLKQDADTFNCYISNEKLEIDEMYLAKYITRADMVGAAAQMMQSFDVIMQLINIFSIAIYMVLMYILTKTVIEKNAVSISFMKVFGYSSREIGNLYLNATTITVLLSLFLCIPLEVLCFEYIMVYISSLMEGYIEFYLPFWVYATIIALGIVAYFLINGVHVYKVKKIPMSEALKDRD